MKNLVKATSLLLTIAFCFGVISSTTAAQQKNTGITVIVSMLLLDDESFRKKLSVTWQRPVMRENNQALNANELDYYRVRYRKVGGSGRYSVMQINAPTTSLNLNLSGETDDQYEISVQAVDTNGFGSQYTDSVTITFSESE